MEKECAKKQIRTRLRRIEGQVKGIEKMVEEDACCRDILIQVAAVRAAVNKVGSIILENYAKQCILKDDEALEEYKNLDKLLEALVMFMK